MHLTPVLFPIALITVSVYVKRIAYVSKPSLKKSAKKGALNASSKDGRSCPRSSSPPKGKNGIATTSRRTS